MDVDIVRCDFIDEYVSKSVLYKQYLTHTDYVGLKAVICIK